MEKQQEDTDTVDWLVRIFEVMIIPILDYGVKVWGAYFQQKLSNRVTIDLWRQILGVGKNVSNENWHWKVPSERKVERDIAKLRPKIEIQ